MRCGAIRCTGQGGSHCLRKMDYEWQALVANRDKIQKKYPKVLVVPASIDEIMLLYVKGEAA